MAKKQWIEKYAFKERPGDPKCMYGWKLETVENNRLDKIVKLQEICFDDGYPVAIGLNTFKELVDKVNRLEKELAMVKKYYYKNES